MGVGNVIRRLARCATAAALVAAALPLGAGELQVASSDGRWLLQSSSDGRMLRIVDARSGKLIDRLAAADRGGVPARIARIVEAPPRQSFVVTLHDVAEAWELVYAPGAEPAFDGLVHDYRMGEAIAQRFAWPLRRIVLDEPQQEFLFAPDFVNGIARARDGSLHVVNLHVRRRIETLRVDGAPAVVAGVSWADADGPLFALPDERLPLVHVIDGRHWRVGRVQLSGLPVAMHRDGEQIRIDAGESQQLWSPEALRRAAGF